ncbi:hypothetical protein LCGC14_1737920 [marine sediment metagenome]|uniref:Uncharacterized protein n=1 Tax=marine sediment metagenome TaxID=412755 RepID=A0A0F9K780_9ZZZZ
MLKWHLTKVTTEHYDIEAQSQGEAMEKIRSKEVKPIKSATSTEIKYITHYSN